MIGVLQYFNLKDRRGFIRADDGGEYSVRGSDFPDPLKPLLIGTRVTFEIRNGTKQARKVKVVP
jgi:cold shock CspA family protein